MKDVLDALLRWRSEGTRAARARLVEIEASSPRASGTWMAANERGEVAGSLSTGCVESALVAVCEEVLADGQSRLVRYDAQGDDLFAVGLLCGGSVLVHVEVDRDDGAALVEWARAVACGEAAVLVTVISGASPGRAVLRRAGAGDSDAAPDELDRILAGVAAHALATGGRGLRTVQGPAGEELVVFVEAPPGRPRLLVFGADDFAGKLAAVARAMGHRVIASDPRAVFATPARLPAADEILVAWPDRVYRTLKPALGPADAVCVLTHDPRIDEPALAGALRSEAGYVGAMGSRRTHLGRLERLRAAGLTPAELARLHGPIGLDIGARTAAETAVSICAEIIAVHAVASATTASLRHRTGPIHDPTYPAGGSWTGLAVRQPPRQRVDDVLRPAGP